MTLCELQIESIMERALYNYTAIDSVSYKKSDEKISGENIVFIVGCPRSGTTYLQRLLACHPKIHTGQESDIFDSYIGPLLRVWNRDLYEPIDGRGGVGMSCYLREEQFMEILEQFMSSLLAPMISGMKPGELFIEKTPSHALYLEEIHYLLPKARIINVLRDPRDVVASLISASRSWGNKWAPKNARDAAWMWLEHISAVDDARRHIPEYLFHEVRFEDLKSNPLQIMAYVIEFLNLKWQRFNIEMAVNDNSAEKVRAGGGTKIKQGGEFKNKGAKQVCEPGGFIRNSECGGWENDLSLKDKFSVWKIARHKMRTFGYEWRIPFLNF